MYAIRFDKAKEILFLCYLNGIIYLCQRNVLMGKTYHTKHEARKIQMSDEATRLTTFHLSRHPNGTRANGLRKVLRTRMKTAAVSFPRDRFGWAEEKSSRLRGGRRNVHKAARQDSRMEISAALDEDTPCTSK
jgi:hypothetical protein